MGRKEPKPVPGKLGKKERLERISMWPLDWRDALRGFLRVDPKKVEERERAEQAEDAPPTDSRTQEKSKD